jgi:Family of unknown function (DUF6166)
VSNLRQTLFSTSEIIDLARKVLHREARRRRHDLAGSMTPHVYSGTRRRDGTTLVSVNGRCLDPRPDFRSQQVTAFDWGYDGQGGPTQLSLAILADLFEDDERARRHCDEFTHDVVGRLPEGGWVLTGAEIESACPEGGALADLADASLLVL